MKKIFVYNPQSGSSLSKATLKRLMQAHKLEVDVWLPINQQFEDKLTDYTQNRCLVYVLGGDGTISSAAAILAHTSSILVPLPGGTLNHFSKDLGVAQDLEVALAQLKHHTDTQIDVASVNDIYFINNSSIGIYAKSLEVRETLKGRLPKWPAAIIANIRVLLQFKRYRLIIDDRSVRSALLFVGNNHYSFSLGKLGTRESLDKGKLTLVITHAFTRMETIMTALRVLIGKGPKQAQLEIAYPKEFTIRTKKSHMTVSHDGEMSRLATPLIYKIHRNALTVRLATTSQAKKKQV